jgi:hypothetical protein
VHVYVSLSGDLVQVSDVGAMDVVLFFSLSFVGLRRQVM